MERGKGMKGRTGGKGRGWKKGGGDGMEGIIWIGPPHFSERGCAYVPSGVLGGAPAEIELGAFWP